MNKILNYFPYIVVLYEIDQGLMIKLESPEKELL